MSSWLINKIFWLKKSILQYVLWHFASRKRFPAHMQIKTQPTPCSFQKEPTTRNLVPGFKNAKINYFPLSKVLGKQIFLQTLDGKKFGKTLTEERSKIFIKVILERTNTRSENSSQTIWKLTLNLSEAEIFCLQLVEEMLKWSRITLINLAKTFANGRV